jgi:hypothetical protein
MVGDVTIWYQSFKGKVKVVLVALPELWKVGDVII